MQTSSIVPTHSKGFASVSPISSCNVGIRFSLSNKLIEKIVFNTVGDRKGDKIIKVNKHLEQLQHQMSVLLPTLQLLNTGK